MSLKINRYLNYGKKMWSDPDFTSTIDGKRDEYTNNFYYSFFELNNGKIIYIMYTENLKSNKLTSSDFECYYTDDYDFKDDFYDWLEREPSAYDNNLGDPTNEEEELVKKFFINYIEKTKEVATKAKYFNLNLSERWYIIYEIKIHKIIKREILDQNPNWDYDEVDEAGGFFDDGDFYFHREIKDDFNFDGNTFHPDSHNELDMLEMIKEKFIINFPNLEILLNNNKFSVKIIEKKFNAYFPPE
jgi:hypothetical protein